MPEKEDKERRKFKRIKKNLYVQCGPWNAAGIWSSVVLQDISQAGLSFTTKKEFPIDEILEIRMTTFMRRHPISLKGRVVDCQKSPQGNNWITRVSLVKVSDEDAGVFEEVIKAFLKETENK
ncbi:MAG: PilZ domain-containing protein [Candidatus Omnitrophota bacterium]|jgi:hypothetical protein